MPERLPRQFGGELTASVHRARTLKAGRPMPAATGLTVPSGGRVFWCAVAGAACVAVLSVATTVGSWSPAGLSGDTTSVFTGVLGASSCLFAAARSPKATRRSWVLFAAVLLLYAAGDVLWLIYGGASGSPAVLSFADALYLMALLPAIVGLLVYPVTRGWHGTFGPLLFDAAVLVAAVLLVSDLFVFDEVARLGGSRLEVFIYLVYPITDVLLVCLVVLLLLRSVGERRPDLVMIGLCFATYTVADNGYALLTVHGRDTVGTVVDLGYSVAPLFLGLAAFSAVTRPRRARIMQRHLPGLVAPLLPDLSAVAALGLFVTLYRVQDSAAWILAASAVGLTGIRQLALTANRQRLRLDLENRIAVRTEDLRQLTEEHSRLDAMKHEFVSAVSHELRTPLTAIQGCLELLADGDAGTLSTPAQGVVDMAARGTHRLARLVDEIIDLERLEQGTFSFHPRPERLAPLLADAVAPLSTMARERGIDLVLTPVYASALCDSDRVIQAVVNLVGNALKFTQPGGRVTVSATIAGDEVVVAIADEGRGIPTAELELIFDRFHQVEGGDERTYAGAGLGLTITRYIVEGHGGHIWVESTIGTGSTFRFTLPRVLIAAETDNSTRYGTVLHDLVLREHPLH